MIIHKRDKELYLLNILWIFPLRLTKKQFYQIRLKDSEKIGDCINVKIRTEICGSHWALSIQQKFRFEIYKFHVPNGTAHSGYTDPTQPTARLVIVIVSDIVSRMQKSGTGDNNFVKWKGTFRSDRPK